jgi:hypothetical protein
MTDRHMIWQLLDRIQMDDRVRAANLVELRSYIASLNLEAGWTPPRPGSPTALHPDACPECEIVAGHTSECSRVAKTPPERFRLDYEKS